MQRDGLQEAETRAEQRGTRPLFQSPRSPSRLAGTRPTLRATDRAKLCANFAYILFVSVKGSPSATNFPPTERERTLGTRADPQERARARSLDLSRIKLA